MAGPEPKGLPGGLSSAAPGLQVAGGACFRHGIGRPIVSFPGKVSMRFPPLLVSIIAVSVCAAAGPPPKKPPALPPARPSQSGAKPAPTHGDPYSVTVPVDASAASASTAQHNAINGGRMKAWMQLSHRLVPPKDWEDPKSTRLN